MGATVTKSGKLDALTVALTQFGGRKVVAPQVSDEQAAKLRKLDASGRPFTAETPALKAAIVARIKGALKRGVIDAASWDREAAEAVKEHVLGRFERQGGDVTLAPLKPSTRAIKARLGHDPRIGIATRALRNALRAAQWIVRRA